MRIRPILFNADMVREILDGRKTVTRRILKLPKYLVEKQDNGLYTLFTEGTSYENQHMETIIKYVKPTYKPGDILYVRETWCSGYDGEVYFYLADKNTERAQKQLIDYDNCKWHPSIHMPKEAARIWLMVKDVRVERLCDMKLDDFLSEGVCIRPEAFNDPENAYMQALNKFITIWNSTIPNEQQNLYSWSANPWVWVIEFERCEKPESEEQKK